ncbi:MAG: hypothetical protein MN733_14555 [Nitrososphaera sp.]|nr:hypothetical protein [Nitrososphaera sp.]
MSKEPTVGHRTAVFEVLEGLLKLHTKENFGGVLARQMVRGAIRMMRNEYPDVEIDTAISALRLKHQAGMHLLPLSTTNLNE